MTNLKQLKEGDKILHIEKNIILVVDESIGPDDQVILANGKVQKYMCIYENTQRIPYDFMASAIEPDEEGFHKVYDFLEEEEGILWQRIS